MNRVLTIIKRRNITFKHLLGKNTLPLETWENRTDFKRLLFYGEKYGQVRQFIKLYKYVQLIAYQLVLPITL